MLKILAILGIALVLVGLTCHGQAEVLIRQDRITIDVQETTIQAVLKSIAEQGQFKIIVLEENTMENVMSSKKFRDLSFEEGFARIFSEWNYGMNRSAETGKIITLYLVSPRAHSVAPSENFSWDEQIQNSKQFETTHIDSEQFQYEDSEE